ncbi:MAG: hypothetical protein B7Z69_00390 [Actinobacteria bacterium 21-73-9]|nr:MAG: hypothetical protein B7Z69_00390 [Actinobacteria bacterium 21-73-9]
MLWFGVVGVVCGLSGAAVAYYSARASSSTVVNVGSAKAVSVVAATGTPSTPLYPGGVGDVTLTVDNPNSFSVRIIALGPSPAASVTAKGGVGPCSVTGVTVSSLTGLDVVVPPGDGDVIDVPGAVTMGPDSQSGCQGATFSVPVSLTVEKP